MTIEYYSPKAWEKKVKDLTYMPSRTFDIKFVVPVEYKDNRVTVLMVGYWFVGR